MTEPIRTFPVLMRPAGWRDHPLCPRSVPWDLVSPHERRAGLNHCGQSLAVLASRGGLSPVELAAVLQDVPFPDNEYQRDPKAVEAKAVVFVVRAVAVWTADPARVPVAVLTPVTVHRWSCTLCGWTGTTFDAPPRRIACPFCKAIHAVTYSNGRPDPDGTGDIPDASTSTPPADPA